MELPTSWAWIQGGMKRLLFLPESPQTNRHTTGPALHEITRSTGGRKAAERSREAGVPVASPGGGCPSGKALLRHPEALLSHPNQVPAKRQAFPNTLTYNSSPFSVPFPLSLISRVRSHHYVNYSPLYLFTAIVLTLWSMELGSLLEMHLLGPHPRPKKRIRICGGGAQSSVSNHHLQIM
uniref:Uncharacterized protein n=1 Tax=Molossus molossus TaxID=27622 RepID=A0A7J8DTN9_MOLMO|nr:hypothetical protein HJG59_009191 [Molossus molossus]